MRPLLSILLLFLLAGPVSAEMPAVDFRDCNGNAQAPMPLVGQNGWTVNGNSPSPLVTELVVGDRSVKAVRAVGDPSTATGDFPQGKPCMASLRVGFRLTEETKVVVVEAEIMVDGMPPEQTAMAGFGKSGPVQFGVDLGGIVTIRTDQWGRIVPAVDDGMEKLRLAAGVWYRFRLEIDPAAEGGKGIARLFLRPLTGDDPRFSRDKDSPISFDISGRRTFSVPVDLRYPIRQWDTVWLRTSNTALPGKGGYLSRIRVSTASALTEVPRLALFSENISKPIRSAEETERMLKLDKSDVLLSSRWKHPSNDKDPHDTMKTIADFHATRLEWGYCDEEEFIRTVKTKVETYGGTVNTIFRGGRKPDEKAYPGQITSRDGKSVAAPWMQIFNGWWGCVNSKEYRHDYEQRLQRLIERGADSIHMDDPALNEATIKWGGCFCPYCIDGFRRFLAARPLSDELKRTIGPPEEFDVRSIGPDRSELWQLLHDFQRESVRRFYVDMRALIREKSDRELLFSTNNFGGNWRFPADTFDFGVSELNEKSAEPFNLFYRIENARRRGKIQIFTMSFRDVSLNRRTYAMMYASGSQAIVPWDVYITSDSPRLFLSPEEFADLPGFVRAMAPKLDRHSTGPVTGASLAELADPSLKLSGSETLCALVRLPDDSKKQQSGVIHLVEWGEPKKTVLALDPETVWKGDRPKEILLWRPAPYEARLHAEAEQSGDYSRLAVSQKIPVRYDSQHSAVVELPPIDVWGIVSAP